MVVTDKLDLSALDTIDEEAEAALSPAFKRILAVLRKLRREGEG